MRGYALGRLSPLAAVQWGLITAGQATREGISRWDLSRLSTDGAIELVAYGVYRITGAPPTPHINLKAAWLQLQPATVAEDRQPDAGVVSHTSAAVLYNVGDFEQDLFEFTRPVRFRTRRDDVIVHTGHLATSEVRRVDQLLVTTPTRLAHDLLAQHHDGQHIGRVLADIIAAGLAEPEDLAAVSAPYAQSHGLGEGDGAGLVSHLTGQVTRARRTSHSPRRTA